MNWDWILGVVFVALVVVLLAASVSRRFRRNPVGRAITGVFRILAGLGALLDAFSNDSH